MEGDGSPDVKLSRTRERVLSLMTEAGRNEVKASPQKRLRKIPKLTECPTLLGTSHTQDHEAEVAPGVAIMLAMFEVEEERPARV